MIGKVTTKLRQYASMVMFSHTLFSLPFAAVSFFWASQGIPSIRTGLLSLLALAGARNGANAINRVVDIRYDKDNPRLASRVTVRGDVSKKEAIVVSVACFALYFLAAALLGPLCLVLSPLPLALIIFYSYTKRFTFLCHLVLGIACAAAPSGAWIAATNSYSLTPFLLSGAVACWVAGFDIIYAVQDIDFDRKYGLFSIPAFIGKKNGLWSASSLHATSVGFLVLSGLNRGVNLLYWVGIALCAGLLIAESILSHKSRASADFRAYTLNQWVSVVFGIFALADMAVFG